MKPHQKTNPVHFKTLEEELGKKYTKQSDTQVLLSLLIFQYHAGPKDAFNQIHSISTVVRIRQKGENVGRTRH